MYIIMYNHNILSTSNMLKNKILFLPPYDPTKETMELVMHDVISKKRVDYINNIFFKSQDIILDLSNVITDEDDIPIDDSFTDDN